MCIHNEGDRVMRLSSAEVTTVTRTSMGGWYSITDAAGHSTNLLPGAHLRTIPEALRHHADALESLAAELNDDRLHAASVLAGLVASLTAAPADADDEVA